MTTMTRADMCRNIRQNASKLLLGEIDYQMKDVDRPEWEGSYDEVCALLDTLTFAEGNHQSHVIMLCRQQLIDIGFYRPMTDEEVEYTVVSSGTPWHFKMDGRAYISDYNEEQWLNMEPGWDMRVLW